MNWNIYDYSEKNLLNRARFLLELEECLRTNPDKVQLSDLENLPDGRHFVTYAPSTGKTSAIRQYLCAHAHKFILYSARLKDDIDLMYFDLLALKSINYKQINSSGVKILKFTSEEDGSFPLLEEITSSNILLITHERLMIEPPDILTRVSNNSRKSAFRDLIFIDEFPIWYKKFKLNDSLIVALGTVLDEAKEENRLEDSLERQSYVYSRFQKLVIDYINNRDFNNQYKSISLKEYGLVKVLAESCKENNITILSGNVNSENLRIQRFAYFANMLSERIYSMYQSSNKEVSSIELFNKNHIFYTISDLEIPNIYIFDGTGDLIIKDSPIWSVIKDSRFSRKLNLEKYPEIIKGTELIRNSSDTYELKSSKSKIKRLAEFVNNLVKSTDKRILLYTWKSVKLSMDYNIERIVDEEELIDSYTQSDVKSKVLSLPELIKSNLSDKALSQTDIIYYQSGKERTTNEFIDNEVVIIAGRFRIPSIAISDFNRINQTNIKEIDYINSLIIQAIYRSKARLGSPVELYFTSDFDESYINNLLSYFELKGITNNFESNISFNSRNKIYYDFISTKFEEIKSIGFADYTITKEVSPKSNFSLVKKSIQNLVEGVLKFIDLDRKSFRLTLI